MKNTRVVIASRAEGAPKTDDFRIEENNVDASDLKDGEILVQTRFISVDPYLLMSLGKKGEMEDSYRFPHSYPMPHFKNGLPRAVGDDFGGRAVGEVLESKHATVKTGDLIAADYGWKDYAVIDVDNEKTFEKLEDNIFRSGLVPLSTALGTLGVDGSHALFGLNKLELKAGQTLAVSGAGGSIGTTCKCNMYVI
jgi:NADPH-dependent curcumin reductase CurA